MLEWWIEGRQVDEQEALHTGANHHRFDSRGILGRIDRFDNWAKGSVKSGWLS
jgi:hypothetical protein